MTCSVQNRFRSRKQFSNNPTEGRKLVICNKFAHNTPILFLIEPHISFHAVYSLSHSLSVKSRWRRETQGRIARVASPFLGYRITKTIACSSTGRKCTGKVSRKRAVPRIGGAFLRNDTVMTLVSPRPPLNNCTECLRETNCGSYGVLLILPPPERNDFSLLLLLATPHGRNIAANFKPCSLSRSM